MAFLLTCANTLLHTRIEQRRCIRRDLEESVEDMDAALAKESDAEEALNAQDPMDESIRSLAKCRRYYQYDPHDYHPHYPYLLYEHLVKCIFHQMIWKHVEQVWCLPLKIHRHYKIHFQWPTLVMIKPTPFAHRKSNVGVPYHLGGGPGEVGKGVGRWLGRGIGSGGPRPPPQPSYPPRNLYINGPA